MCAGGLSKLSVVSQNGRGVRYAPACLVGQQVGGRGSTPPAPPAPFSSLRGQESLRGRAWDWTMSQDIMSSGIRLRRMRLTDDPSLSCLLDFVEWTRDIVRRLGSPLHTFGLRAR